MLAGPSKGARLPGCFPGPGLRIGPADVGAEAGPGREMPEGADACGSILLRRASAGLLMGCS